MGFFREASEQMFDLFAVFELATGGRVGSGVFDGGLVRVDMTERVEESLFSHAANDDSAGDDGEVGGEGGPPAEFAEGCHVTEQQFSKGVSAEVVSVVRGKSEAVGAGGLANDLPNQAGVAINEEPPAAGIAREQFVQQLSIAVGERHSGVRLR